MNHAAILIVCLFLSATLFGAPASAKDKVKSDKEKSEKVKSEKEKSSKEKSGKDKSKKSGKTEKVAVCHISGSGSISLIQIAENAVQKHFEKHGDYFPSTLYRDQDGDGLGDPSNSILACEPIDGYVTNSSDPDDTTASDVTPPGDVTDLTAEGVTNAVLLNWQNPADPDFDGVVVLQDTAPNTAVPASGMAYVVGDLIGTSKVIFVGQLTSLPVTGLDLDTTYFFKVHAFDTSLNYASGVEVSGMAATPPPETLIEVGDTWQIFKGNAMPAAGWDSAGFDASSWFNGPTGIGYSTDITYATTLADMRYNYVSFYMRRTFDIDAAWTLSALILEASYDDGFIAYINGVEVARSSSMAGQTNVTNTTTSNGSHDEEAGIETFDLSTAIDLLNPGSNVLAIEVHNVVASSSDAGIVPALRQIASVGPDFLPPDDVTNLQVNEGDGAVSMSWSNPGDLDFAGVLILQSSFPIIDAPEYGTSYANGDSIGTATVAYVGRDEFTIISSLNNGEQYYFKAFAFDEEPNYALGVDANGQPKVSAPNIIFVDNTLVADCNNYLPTGRVCGGGSETAFASFASATASTIPGDSVAIRGGIYNEVLHIIRSGGPNSPVSYYNHDGESVFIDGVNSVKNGESYGPLWLDHANHISVKGIGIRNSVGFGRVVGSHHNTISNMRFLNTTLGLGSQSKRGGFYVTHSSFNRINGNSFAIGTDSLALVNSNRNLIEGNSFADAGHDNLALKCSSFNIVRSNTFANSNQKNMAVMDCEKATLSWHGNDDYARSTALADSTSHNLIELNQFIRSGTNEGGPQSTSDSNGIQYSAQKGIIRHNVFYNHIGPALGMQVYADEAEFNVDNRVYNNTVSNSQCGGMSARRGVVGAIYKNNILAGNEQCDGGGNTQVTYRNPFPGDHVFVRNNIFGTAPGQQVFSDDFAGTNTLAYFALNFPGNFIDNLEVDPLFTDAPNHDYSLAPGSQMIDAGAYLTTVVGSGTGSALVVVDTGYFFDGNGIAGEVGDLIQLEGSPVTARVLDVNHATNTLILDSELTYADGQGVALGYQGAGPDIGAFEKQ